MVPQPYNVGMGLIAHSDLESARDRLIIALDYPSAAAALSFVDRLEGRCLWFKVGLELYLGAGPGIIETLRSRGFQVFLDLKLHDIPNTVAAAIRSVSSLGATLLTVHASGGPAMLVAAVQAAAETPHAPGLLGVTVLTSMDGSQLAATGVPGEPGSQALRLARLCIASGINGLVCSPQELPAFRAELGASPLLVTPGIRPAGSPLGDQSRVATPAEAIGAGASKIVVGRPVTRAQDPAATVDAILNSLVPELTTPAA